ncbi:MAG: MaoC family dehydratase N-terminal domain-containing protein [Hyphomicrobiaceae bacterium]|nr:MaoC family dehydratase N-terminal domain-containing protein [Hyphomicrobiaceae bacterium]
MTAIDAEALRRHIGTRMTEEDTATEAPLRMLVATFDRPERAPKDGESIPPGWHIGYFLNMAPQASLSADGLPTGAGVLPKMPLPRRMYAGCRITFHDDIRVGDRIVRETTLSDLQVRQGSTGTLVFATQTRRISTPRGLALTEEYDGAFREEVKEGAKSGIPKREEPPAGLPWRRTIKTNAVSLFRFSAITFNPHRIHYDTPYATGVEGYPGLVVHGPYSQHCLSDFVRDMCQGRPFATFHMRARAPLFETEPFDLVGRPSTDGRGAEAWALTPSGTIAMQATVTFAR